MSIKYFILLLICFVMAISISASPFYDLPTAAQFLVGDMLSQLSPMEAEVIRIFGDDIVLDRGQRDGARLGQVFEIYSSSTDEYLGLARIAEARRRESAAEMVEMILPISPGDIADEIVGGRLAIYGFLNQDGHETKLSRSFAEMMATVLARQFEFEVIERQQLEQHLDERRLSYTGLLSKDAPEVGKLLGADLIVIGSITVMSDEIIINARMNETETGRMLSSSSLRLFRTPSLDALLEIHEQSRMTRLVAEPDSIALYIGESANIAITAYDHEGFLIDVAPQWSRSSDFVAIGGEGKDIAIKALAAGRGQVRASVGESRAIIDVLVMEPPKLSRLVVDPSSAAAREGEPVYFKVIGLDQYGNEISINPRWSVAGEGRLSSVTGSQNSFIAEKVGSFVIEIADQDILATVSVEVFRDPSVLLNLEIVSDLKARADESIDLKAIAKDQYGEEMDLTFRWSVVSGRGRLDSRLGAEVSLTPLDTGFIIVHLSVDDMGIRRMIEVIPEAAEVLSSIGSQSIHRANNVIFNMRLAPAATFPTGVDDSREATVDYAFWIAETPATYELWHEVYVWAVRNGYKFANRGREGSHGDIGGAPTNKKNEPVTLVSWRDSIVWCNALTEYYNALHGASYEVVYTFRGQVIRDATDANACDNAVAEDRNGFRLPTSEEWELAARYKESDRSHRAIEYPAGSGNFWSPGNYASGATANYGNAAVTQAAAWYSANSGGKTQDVGQKPSGGNGLGLFDMSGNVWEWCFTQSGSYRVRRGGSWYSTAYGLQVGYIVSNSPGLASYYSGFRFLRTHF